MRGEEIQIDEFRKVFDENCLERGWYDYKNGWVKSFKKTSSNFYEAVLDGAAENLVLFHLENKMISEYFCTCHYKFGKPCRHLAAVLFLMESRCKEQEKSKVGFKKITLKNDI